MVTSPCRSFRRLMPEIDRVRQASPLTVNYGCEKVRFPSPVPVGSRLRATAAVQQVSEISGGVQLAVEMTMTVEGAAKPACVAIILIRQYA